MYKLSALYKHVIQNLTGVKNDMEFEALMLIWEEYMAAKEEEFTKSTAADCEDE